MSTHLIQEAHTHIELSTKGEVALHDDEVVAHACTMTLTIIFNTGSVGGLMTTQK